MTVKNAKYADGSFVKDGVIYRKWYLLYELGEGFYSRTGYTASMSAARMHLFNNAQANRRLKILGGKKTQIFKIPVEVAFNIAELSTVVSVCQDNEDATMQWLTEHVRETLRNLGKVDS